LIALELTYGTSSIGIECSAVAFSLLFLRFGGPRQKIRILTATRPGEKPIYKVLRSIRLIDSAAGE